MWKRIITMMCRVRKKRRKLIFLLFLYVFGMCLLAAYWWKRNAKVVDVIVAPDYVTDLCFVLDKNLLAVILVNSANANADRRRLIRSTWANKYMCRALKIAVVFIVGSSSDPALERAVSEERKQYGDVLKVHTLDSYRHLVEKIVNGINWSLSTCPSTKFVLKIDDDAFVNVFALQRYLESANDHREANHFLCLVWSSIQVQRNPASKWYVPEYVYPYPTYPPYCSGLAYVMPFNVAHSVTQLYLSIPKFWIEDVYITGMLAREGNFSHFQIGHFYGFVDYRYSDVVSGKLIFTHINKNETLVKGTLWNGVMAYEKKEKNPLVDPPETYIVANDTYEIVYEYESL